MSESCSDGFYLIGRNHPLPKGKCPTCDGSPSGRASGGEPIEIATGNMTLVETDFTGADPRLQFTRTYDSNSTDNTPVGNAWFGSFDGRRIYPDFERALPPPGPPKFRSSRT